MNIKYNLPIFLLIIIFIASSCKKDISRTELLTTGSWKLIALEASLFGMTTDSYAEMEECEKDNLFTFKSDNTLEIDEGPTKCDPDDPQIRKVGPWTLFDNDNKINMDSIDFNILELTETRFKINGTAMELGFIVTVELTYGR